jgi:5-methylcytosine-specific restriction endonuclease McrA
MPKSACLTCHRLIPLGQSHCSAHTRTRKPRKRPGSTARGLGYEYQKNRGVVLSVSTLCILCGRAGSNTADHLKPRHHGIDNSLGNLAPAHLSCNSKRQTKALTPEQWGRVEAYRLLLTAYLSGR